MGRASLCLLFVLLLAGGAFPQPCGSAGGSPYCGSGLPGLDPAYGGASERDSRVRRRPDELTPFSGMQGYGIDFVGNERPTTFGAITFGGGEARCGGLFRSRSC